MKINKLIIFIVIFTSIITFSCSNKSSSLEGTYVREVSNKNPDTIFITHIKDNYFQIEARQWKKGLKKSKSTTGTLDKNKIYFENGNVLSLTEDNTIMAGKIKYVKIK